MSTETQGRNNFLAILVALGRIQDLQHQVDDLRRVLVQNGIDPDSQPRTVK